MNGGPGDKTQLGKIALKQKLVAPNAIEELLAHPTAGRGSVDRIKALSEQHGVPGLDLQQVVVPLDNLKLIPHEISRAYGMLAVVVKEDRILLAMMNPGDRRPIDEIEFVTGRRVHPYVALADELRRAIDEAYKLFAAGEDYYVGPGCSPEYLTSIGLAHLAERQPAPRSAAPQPSPAIAPPAARPPGAPNPKGPQLTPLVADELGIDELAAKRDSGAGLDDAFGSRVGPLPHQPSRTASGQPRILVVDDEDDIRKMLVRVLAQKGYQVIEASKGLEALQIVRDQVPDLILLDAMLPEVHGFDICRRIKGSARYGHIPIIMVSAIYRGWRVAEDLKSSYGVDAFLEKPFKIGDVLVHVENALAGRAKDVREDDILGREAQSFLDQALTAYRGGNLDSAIDRLREGLAIDPLAFQLHYHLGLLYGRRDQLFDAIHELERAVDLQPRNFSALKNLAVLYQRVGFKHKATEIWERALASAPDDETRQGIKEHLMNLL